MMDFIQLMIQKLSSWKMKEWLLGSVAHSWLYWRKYKFLVGLIVIGLAGMWVASRPRHLTLTGNVSDIAYHIQYRSRRAVHCQEALETLVRDFEQTLSLEYPASSLALLNQHGCSDFPLTSPFLYPILTKSKEVHRNTDGAFDPTVLPLVQTWQQATLPTAAQLVAVREWVGLDYVVVNEQRAKKLKRDVRLDLGGIAPGYRTDLVVDLLHTHGVQDMLVEMGHTVRACGKYQSTQPWQTMLTLGTDNDGVDQDALQVKVTLADQALSYRCLAPQSRHCSVIDPATGFPTTHSMRSIVVLAPDCMTAQAYVTAVMARGLAFAQKLTEAVDRLAVFIVYEDDQKNRALYASENLHVHQPQEGVVELNWVTPRVEHSSPS